MVDTENILPLWVTNPFGSKGVMFSLKLLCVAMWVVIPLSIITNLNRFQSQENIYWIIFDLLGSIVIFCMAAQYPNQNLTAVKNDG